MIELVRNLIFNWHYMRASENLLVVAAANTREPVLRDWYLKHLEEERHHGEWLAEDLATVGVKVERTCLPREVMEMVGGLYYLIFHVDSCALLGYMCVLENWPFTGKFEQWRREYPESLLRTLKVHAEKDPDHAAEIAEQIARLKPEQISLVDQTSAMTAQYLTQAVEGMRKAA